MARQANATRLMMVLSLAASPLVLVALPSLAAENDQGAQLAAMCAACHRLDGLDHGIPSIIGLDESKFAGMMVEFRSDARKSQIMGVVARSLSDAEIADLARYLGARQKRSERP